LQQTIFGMNLLKKYLVHLDGENNTLSVPLTAGKMVKIGPI
jgi:hypothetical protein